jgi:hypothetical protein
LATNILLWRIRNRDYPTENPPNDAQVLEIEVFGQARIDDHRYYCDPLHGRKRAQKQNWAFVNFEGKIYPCQLLCLISIPEQPEKEINLNGTVIDGAGKYFIVH